MERYLLVHGIQSYPNDFKKLLGLQDALGEKKYAAALTCLQHLEQTSNIDDLKANDCIYILDMVQKHLINDPGIEYTSDLEAMLIKIIYQVPAEDSKKLSDYILANMDK